MNRRNHYIKLACVFLVVLAAIFLGVTRFPQEYRIVISKHQFTSLRVEMNKRQVVSTLGLNNYFEETWSGGPRGYFEDCFATRGGRHSLVIIQNFGSNPPMLVSVILDEQIWNPPVKM